MLAVELTNRPPRKIPRPETQRSQHGKVNHHAARDQLRQAQDARPARAGQPALLRAHAEPQRECQRSQRDHHFDEEFRPAFLWLVNAALAQIIEQDGGIQARGKTDRQGQSGVVQPADEQRVQVVDRKLEVGSGGGDDVGR